jgi:hypothetical protein
MLPLARREPFMPYYRLRHLDHEDRTERFDDFLAPHDEAAKAFALDQLGGQSLELWQQARMITRFNAVAAQVHALRDAEGGAVPQ